MLRKPDTYTSKEMLARLVGFPTVSSESNLALIYFVQDYLADLRIETDLILNETGEKASLVALIGPKTSGGVILSGHTDVVPIEGQSWSSLPFLLTEQDGKQFGRGTCDMKGFCATALALVPVMLSAELKRPIILAFSYDEEIGCIGAPPMIEFLDANLPSVSAVIVGEPTLMKVVNGHKGIMELRTHVKGHEHHSSLMHESVSAVMVAARLIEWVSAQNENNKNAADPASPYTPPWTTLHVGQIEGGTAHNITAGRCSFTTDIRTVPNESSSDWLARYQAFVSEVETQMKAIRPETGIEIEVVADVPGCDAEPGGAAEELVRQLTGDNATSVVSYGTEAGLFQKRGLSTVICGPGSIEQAHKPDEYIAMDQLDKCEAFIRRLIDKLSTD